MKLLHATLCATKSDLLSALTQLGMYQSGKLVQGIDIDNQPQRSVGLGAPIYIVPPIWDADDDLSNEYVEDARRSWKLRVWAGKPEPQAPKSAYDRMLSAALTRSEPTVLAKIAAEMAQSDRALSLRVALYWFWTTNVPVTQDPVVGAVRTMMNVSVILDP